MPGPPADPNAIRRNPRVGLVMLPAKGFTGRIPKWPLPDNPRLTARITLLEDELEPLEEREFAGEELAGESLSRTERTKMTRLRERLAVAKAERDAVVDTEKELWRKLWRTPQAVKWAQMHWDREVAQYVRHKAAAEIGSLDDSREARQRADALGLSPKGMRHLLWTIAEDEVAAKRDQRQAETGTEGRARRSHLSAVDKTES